MTLASALSEKLVSFPAPDGKTIYGTLTTQMGEKSDGLVIYAHGLGPSSPDDYTYLHSSRLISRKGFDTLRIAFYDWRKNARCLSNCDIETHVTDLEATIKRFRKQYRHVFLIGHSWGGLTIMHSACKGVSGVSLWDPSFAPALWWKGFTRKHSNLLLAKGSYEFVLSPKMRDQALSLNREACRKLGQKFTAPLQVIQAGQSAYLSKMGETFSTHASGKTEHHWLPEAEHFFLSEVAQQKLALLTSKWFKKLTKPARL